MVWVDTLGRGVVYYIGTEQGGAVKIGTTVDVEKRLARLQRDRPRAALVVLATEKGGAREEAERHHRFRESRLAHEWFALTPDLQEHIDALREGASS
ncbi:GIY-YIG nuclease family protein [Microbacterium trichothecenolyticum]